MVDLVGAEGRQQERAVAEGLLLEERPPHPVTDLPPEVHFAVVLHCSAGDQGGGKGGGR